ncbi:GNAT family N-acetyltransferase [Muriicola marianensis]|uniref:BioF2-like acetyltransferase domain-containing protein n=1 Tax=Muriicola marianensis TaxID=1324801 RepID=A0ABQ1QQK4_9FLAO|nr:GNAT family N-acetyltransferase [Muriicola marianensis]GGD41095.1 hypothetical protein GCM10011361_05230 [Muriicola marianensis]
MTKVNLQVLDLYTLDGRLRYKKALNEINPDNPYYRTELLFIDWNPRKHLRCFVYVEDYTPKVIMPFYLIPIPVMIDSLPYFDMASPWGHNGPLYQEGTDPVIFTNFWKLVDEWYRQNNVITEFIRFGFNGNHTYYNGSLKETLMCVNGQLIDREPQFANFKPKVRNNYRKALKNQLTFKLFVSEFPEEITRAFYDIFTHTMERLRAEERYFFPYDFFVSLVEKNPDSCAIAMVYHEGTPVSTELLLLSKSTIYSFLGGTRSEFFDLRPNDFLKINVMDWGREQLYERYFLGGGKEDRDTLYQYKKSFFPKEADRPFYTGRKIINKEAYDHILREMPVQGHDVIKLERKKESYFPLYRTVEKAI